MLKRSYSITSTPASFAESMMAPPEPVSMLVSTITPASAAIACSAWDCWVAASPSAFTMVCSIPASLNALSKYGRSSLSQRGELALSGSRTQISLSHAPPDADVPVAAAPCAGAVVTAAPGCNGGQPEHERQEDELESPPCLVLCLSKQQFPHSRPPKFVGPSRLMAQRYGGWGPNSRFRAGFGQAADPDTVAR